MYLINYVSAVTLATGRMIPSLN